jgi:hypothetical protein
MTVSASSATGFSSRVLGRSGWIFSSTSTFMSTLPLLVPPFGCTVLAVLVAVAVVVGCDSGPLSSPPLHPAASITNTSNAATPFVFNASPFCLGRSSVATSPLIGTEGRRT